MLKIVQEKEKIERFYRLFSKRLRVCMDSKTAVTIGHPGGNFPAHVMWSRRLGIWMHRAKGKEGSLLNAFGTQEPFPGDPLSITCEINFSPKGLDRRFGAAFAVDDDERPYVIHRGRISGGRRGIGKSVFHRRFRGVWTVVDEGGTAVSVAVVGCLASHNFPRQLARFVHCVGILKQQAVDDASSQTSLPFTSCRFKRELTGETCEESPINLPGFCDVALVVEDLAARLEQHGFKTANDPARDLVVMTGDERTAAVFQVIADVRRRSVQEGAAKLMFHNPPGDHTGLLILVLPGTPDADLTRMLAARQISPLSYAWREGSAVFPGLGEVMAAITHGFPAGGSPPG
ncbi:MAG: hypothetical protein N2Z74_01185 [Syntrophales bacterium]|nr:hypothetical protein [Syntrophales bacterium]